jgi:D-tyrosyl-tRNA(Tyr) deacylase
MIGLLQRVTAAQVVVEGNTMASIETGILVLVGFQANDQVEHIPRFIERITESIGRR